MRMRKRILTVVIITLLTTLPGCTGTPKAETTDPTAAVSLSSGQKLNFSVIEAETPGATKEALGENADTFIVYSGLSEVNISMDGTDIPLAEAVRNGKLTLPEIFAFARMDAQNGFCSETYASERGLTYFTYTYPECELHLAYDVYETPDGKQTLIEEISVYNIVGEDTVRNIGHIYVDDESEWGYFIDREDWGITFTVAEVSPTQITLDYTQQGGQQIGDLLVDSYMLYSAEASEDSDGFIGMSKRDSEGLPIPLMRDSSGQITIDWTADAGTLEPGDYYLRLSISDSYEESEVHPLIVKYHDKQGYHVEFSVE